MENYGCCPTENAVSHAAWDKGVTPRINRLRNQYWTYRPTLDLERAVSYTKTYRESYPFCLFTGAPPTSPTEIGSNTYKQAQSTPNSTKKPLIFPFPGKSRALPVLARLD